MIVQGMRSAACAAGFSIAGAAFNRALTRIRIGDTPVQADSRKAIPGG